MKNKSLFFSFLVPNYGFNPYIECCISSLVNQKTNNLFNYEIIFSDQSPHYIAEKNKAMIEEKFSNIVKYVKCDSVGLLKNRHNLVKYANGYYLVFVDSDDFVDDDFLITIYHELKNDNEPDVLIHNFLNCNTFGIDIRKINPDPSDVKDHIFDYFNYTDLLNSVWRKVFKKSLYSVSDYSDFETVNGEDYVFSYPLINKAKAISYKGEIYKYHYRLFNNSMMHSYSLEIGKKTIELRYAYIDKYGFQNTFQRQIFLLNQINAFSFVFSYLIKNKKMTYKEYLNFVKDFKITIFEKYQLTDTKKLNFKQNLCYHLLKTNKNKFLYFLLKIK